MRSHVFTTTAFVSAVLSLSLACGGEGTSGDGSGAASSGGTGAASSSGGSAGVAGASSPGGSSGSSGSAAAGSGNAPSAGQSGMPGGGANTGGAPSGGAPSGGAGGSGGSVGPVVTLPSPPCSDAGAWRSADSFGLKAFDPYVIRNNEWNGKAAGAGTQELWATNSRCWGVTATHTDAAPKGTVKSYADIARGWVVSAPGFSHPNHGLAIRVSELTKAKIRWKMQAPTTGRTWALWDIYFHETTMPSASRAPVNLMIQQRIVDSDGWMQMDSSAWTRVTIAGYTFRQKLETTSVSSTRNRIVLYADYSSGWVLGVDDMVLDLKAVIDHYVAQGSIRSTDYLTSIQAGWEIVSGGSYKTDDFWTAVQDEPDPN